MDSWVSRWNWFSTNSMVSCATKQASIVIVNSRFLHRPQKRYHGNQLIHRSLSKTKSIGSGSDPESQAGRQAGRQSDCCGGWYLELELRRVGGREKRMNQDRIC